MDCELIQPDLVAYHFGEIGSAERAAVEAHLGACPRCLRDYFALKRALETTEARPSPSARARLQRAVAAQVTEGSRARGQWSWWERPLALVLACATVLLMAFVTDALASTPGGPPHGWVMAKGP